MLGKQVRSVWYFADASDGFLAAIALQLNTEVFNKGESTDTAGKLCIVNKGLVFRGGMVKGRGSTWGEDFVLSPSLRREMNAWVLVFAELLTLSHMDFHDIFASVSSEDFRFCRRIIVKMTVMRGIVREAGRLLKEEPALKQRLNYRLRSEPGEESTRSSNKMFRCKTSILLTNLEKKRVADEIADEDKERRTAILEKMAEADLEELSKDPSGSPQTGVSVSLIRHVIRAELQRSESQSDLLLQRVLDEVGQIRQDLNAVASQAPHTVFLSELSGLPAGDIALRETAAPVSSSADLPARSSLFCGSSVAKEASLTSRAVEQRDRFDARLCDRSVASPPADIFADGMDERRLASPSADIFANAIDERSRVAPAA
jgi:hypothetical protein